MSKNTSSTSAAEMLPEFESFATRMQKLAAKTMLKGLVGFSEVEVTVSVRDDFKFVLAVTEDVKALPASFGGTTVVLAPVDCEQWLFKLLLAKEVAHLNAWRAAQTA